MLGADIGLDNIETDGAFAKAYSEALNNVSEHAQSDVGAQVAASHFDRAGRMTFAVADRGIGIVAHLKRRHGAGYADPELLQMALEPAVSGTFALGKVSGRTHYGVSNAGLGLYVMRNIAQKSKGSLTVVTGGYVAQVGADGNVDVRSCDAPWAGTSLCVSYQTALTGDAMTAIQDAMNVAVHSNRKRERITFDAMQVGSNAVQVRLRATYGAAIADKQHAIRLRDEELLPAIRDNRNVVIDLTDGSIIAHSCAHALLYQVIVEAGPASRSRVCVRAKTRQIKSVVRQVSYFAGALDE
ncbi:MAG: ATP-binding protein [Deltaproteobacteria bacterium]|nr:MAG: ATP-binding protein [Deltaproteobacteria bacterium]